MRRQLPVYSPLDLASWTKACLLSLTGPLRPSASLASLLAQRYPCEGVVLTGSGTQALQLAIRLGLDAGRSGAPVGLPAYSCFDVLTAAVGAGASVLFYDLDPETLAPDMEGLRDVVANGACAVVVASLYGYSVDWDAVQDCCAEAGAVLIEDSAQGLGSSWRGREGGTFGDLTVVSFGRGKGWTGGGGGALLFRMKGWEGEEALTNRLLPARVGAGVRAAAKTLGQWGLGRPSLYAFPSALPWLGLGETTYKEPVPVRAIPSFSAALAAATADAAAAAVAGRRRTAAELQDLLVQTLPSTRARPVRPLESSESSYLRFPLLGTAPLRSVLQSPRAGSLGILPGYPSALPNLPAADRLRRDPPRGFLGAEDLSRDLFTLPTHSLLRQEDLHRLFRLLSSSSSRWTC